MPSSRRNFVRIFTLLCGANPYAIVRSAYFSREGWYVPKKGPATAKTWDWPTCRETEQVNIWAAASLNVLCVRLAFFAF